MSNMLKSRTAAITMLTLLVMAGGAQAASARPDPADVKPHGVVLPPMSCPLERIGTQLVRCDNFTGAGVAAPAWIPELEPFLAR
jgi:hypothetical protein